MLSAPRMGCQPLIKTWLQRRMQRIRKRNTNLVRDICFAPANYNSRQTVFRPIVKAYQNLWEHWRRGTPGKKVLGGDDRRGNSWTETLRMDDFWHVEKEIGSGFHEKAARQLQRCKSGKCWGMQSNPNTCSLGCGKGSETVRMYWGQNGKDLEFNPKDISKYRQLGEMKFKRQSWTKSRAFLWN